MKNRIVLKTGICFLLFMGCLGTCAANSSVSFVENDTTIINKKVEDFFQKVDKSGTDSGEELKNIYSTLEALGNEFNTYKTKVLVKIIEFSMKRGDFHFADSVSFQMVQDANQQGDSIVFPRVYQTRGNVFYQKGMFDSSAFYFQYAEQFAGALNNQSVQMNALLMYGVSLVRAGEYEKGSEVFKRGIDLSTEYNDFQTLAEMQQSLAIVSKRTGKIATALQLNKSAIENLESIGSMENYPEVLNNLAVLYMELGVDSLAIQYFQKSVDVARETERLLILGIGLTNLARFDMQYGCYESARDNIMEALRLVEDRNLGAIKSSVMSSYGQYQMELANSNEAKSIFTEAFEIAKKNKDINDAAYSAINLAELFLNENELDSSLFFAEYVYNISQKNDLLPEIIKSSRIIGKIHERKNNLQLALQYYKMLDSMSIAYQDSLNVNNNRNFGYRYELQRKETENKMLQNDAKLNQLELEKRNEKIKKQRVILLFSVFIVLASIIMIIIFTRQARAKSKINHLLQEKNAEITIANKKLKEENEFKTKLFSIVSHDVRSPVLSLYQLLKLIASGKLSREEMDQVMAELSEKTSHTINLIDNILMWTRQQISGNIPELKDFDISLLIEDSIAQFRFSADKNKIHLQNNVPPGIHVHADPNTASLVLRNLISNALKFTQSGGSVTLASHEMDKKWVFTVTDTGQGIKEEDKNKILDTETLLTSRGARGEKGTGLGLLLCKRFIEQNNGNIWFESDVGKGSCFYFTFSKV
ncbi:MAG: ATP-binding protein [Bacteroidales bacterium]